MRLRSAEFEAETDRATCGVTKAHRSPRGWRPVRVDNAHSGQRRPCLLLRSFGPFRLELRFHLQRRVYRRACKSLVRTFPGARAHPREHCAQFALLVAGEKQDHDGNLGELKGVLERRSTERILGREHAVLVLRVADLAQESIAARGV